MENGVKSWMYHNSLRYAVSVVSERVCMGEEIVYDVIRRELSPFLINYKSEKNETDGCIVLKERRPTSWPGRSFLQTKVEAIHWLTEGKMV